MARAAVEKRRRKAKVEVTGPDIPPELLLRRDHSIRFERGGTVYGTDGRVGVLRQVVVDEQMGEVAELIVLVDGSERTVVLTPDLVDKTAGSAVFMTVNRAQFAERAATAPEYEKKHFAKVDTRVLFKQGEAATERNPRRAIVSAGGDFVETPAVSLVDRLDRKQGVLA